MKAVIALICSNFTLSGPQNLEENIFGSVLRKAESGIFSSLGKSLGFDTGEKPDGTKSNPLHVINVGGIGAGADGGGIGSTLSHIPLIGKLFGSLGGGAAAGIAPPDGTQNNPFYVMDASGSGGLFGGGGSSDSGSGSGGGGLFSTILGALIPRAEGGSVVPGQSYTVGEKRPELFVPRSAGTIVPSLGGDTKNITVQNHPHISGVNDADSFKRSQHQIFTQKSRGQQLALARG
jgi:hypothetical protein